MSAVSRFVSWFVSSLRKNATRSEWMTYVIVYFFWGLAMHNVGILLNIARFTYW